MNARPAPGEALAVPDHVPPGLVYDFDYVSDPILTPDPYRGMAELLERAPPIFFTPRHGGHWVCTSYREAVRITRNPALFSSRFTGRIPKADEDVKMFPISIDPPEHGIYRKPIARIFGPQAMFRLRDAIREMVVRLIEDVLPTGECDFLKAVAEPVPLQVFLTLMGMPLDRLQEFRDLAVRAVKAASPEEYMAAMDEIGAINRVFIDRARDGEGDDVVSRLWRTGFDGRAPRYDELESVCLLLFVGGLDTVVNGLCFGLRRMAIDSDLQQRLRDDPSLIPDAVEEFLRLHGIAQLARLVTQDTDYEGVHGPVPMRKDEMVLVLVSAANLDPEMYDEPGTAKLRRATPHMTFGAGVHRCLGSHLARIELAVVYEEWLRRVPPFALDPANPPRLHAGRIMGVDSLHLKWDPAATHAAGE